MSPVVLTGLKELQAELRAASLSAPAEVRMALREGAEEVKARAQEIAPKKTGKLAGSYQAYATTRSAGVRSSHPGAGVQEFATNYLRHPPGSGGRAVSRSVKRHVSLGHMTASDSGMVEVHMVRVGPKGPSGGRIAYKAIDDLGDELVATTFDRVVNVLKCNGWFV